MIQDQFKKGEHGKEDLKDKLDNSLIKVNTLERNLSEANEVINRNDRGASRMSEMTHTFGLRSGLGFLDTPLSNSENIIPGNIKFVKSGFGSAPESSSSKSGDNGKR